MFINKKTENIFFKNSVKSKYLLECLIEMINLKLEI